MTMKRLSIFLSLLLLLAACGKSDDVEQSVTPNTPELPTNPDTPGNPDENPTNPDTPSTPDDDLNGHEYVDLGLPSGTLWATTNVGATLPADYGDYFAWGETSPKSDYDWGTCKWTLSDGTILNKYNTSASHGTVDNKTVLEAADDAATINWGSVWRMPTDAELQELLNSDYCTWRQETRTNSNGKIISGYEVKSKSNGNSIFLPAAGDRFGERLYDVGEEGCYWSSSLNSRTPGGAYRLYFYSDNHNYGRDSYARLHGCSVRPVRSTNDTPSTPVIPNDGPHKYVDLKLPSGTLWATTNIGATSPADYGNYYAWGETRTKTNYDWNTYKWCNGSWYTITKYCTSSSWGGIVDNKSVLEAADDAATANWGSDWRLPTAEELQELNNTDYCIWTWRTRTNSKGEAINGYEVTSKSNGNFIFLPAGGSYSSTSHNDVGTWGRYWSSSLYSATPYAHSLYFYSGGHESISSSSNNREKGLPVRPVRTTTLK